MAVSELRKSQIVAFVFILLGIAITIALSISNADAFKVLAVFAVLVITPLFFLRPELAFLTLIVMRPVIDVLGQQVTFNIRDAITINLGGVIGIAVVVWGSLYLIYKRARIFSLPVFYPLFALSILSLISIVSSDFRTTVFGEWVRVTSFAIIFLLGYHFITNLHNFRRVTTAALFSAVIPAALGLFQLVTRTGLSDEASSNRIFATFAHPSLFAQYLAALMVLILVLILLFSRYTFGYLFTYVILGFFLLFTFSRGAWVFAIIGSVLLGITFYREHLHKVLLFGLGVLLVLASVGLLLQSYTSFKPINTSVVSRLTQTAQLNPDNSIVWRFQFWEKSLMASKPYLLRGYGAGTFLDFSEREVNSSFEAHNDFLKLMIETGVLGAASLVAFFLTILVWGIRSYVNRKTREEKILALFIISEVLGMIFVSFFDNLYQNTTFYWIILALFGGTLHLLSNIKRARRA